MSIEKRIGEWLKQPGAAMTKDEWDFITMMRKFAARGVGYGWMQQVIEWEWQDKSGHSWGPEYFEKRIRELEAKIKSRGSRTGSSE